MQKVCRKKYYLLYNLICHIFYCFFLGFPTGWLSDKPLQTAFFSWVHIINILKYFSPARSYAEISSPIAELNPESSVRLDNPSGTEPMSSEMHGSYATALAFYSIPFLPTVSDKLCGNNKFSGRCVARRVAGVLI